ncbi:MAG: phospholipase phosphocholine-specific [Marmoricola sp.]|jgi:phospholipase C|nr:phospholipase phosphocholine-specific [Marmoricola sp.]
MTDINRRRFLQLAGASAAVTTLSSSIARAARIPAHRATGSLRDVEHIVVLMQENRSFDHYFGSLRGVRGFGDPRPVLAPSGRTVWHQSDGHKDLLPFHPSADNLGLQFLGDLAHDWNSGHAAFRGGAYDRWVPAKGPTTMAYLDREDIPFHYALADAFTVCDAYHCSLMGPTDPNRYYLWTGYTGNDGVGGGPVLSEDELGYGWTTYPERLQAAGVSWKLYQDIGDGLDAAHLWGLTEDAFRGNYGDNSLLFFNNYRNARPGDPLHDKARTGTDVANGDGYFDILRADVLGGRLPQISWITAPEAFSEHPNWPANYGAWYIAQVLDALTADPEVWSKTALFITYDENDGFFDHLVPPFPPVSPGKGASTVDVHNELYDRADTLETPGPFGLGPRVPMIVVSPWSTGGRVCSQTFDHTSILRFMEARFGVREPNISAWRRTVCGDLTSAFDFAAADQTLPALPGTSAYLPADHNRQFDYIPVFPPGATLPRQERGLRSARPLPYDLSADADVHPATGTLGIAFANHGKAGAQFLVTAPGHLDSPWTYTVGAGRSLRGSWPISGFAGRVYDLTVHGPNGFLRRARGKSAAAGPEVTVRNVAISSGRLRVTLVNHRKKAVRFTFTDGYGHRSAVTYSVPRRATRVHTIDLAATHGWYDVRITAVGLPGWLRRFAGHVETGRASTSDPAIGAV